MGKGGGEKFLRWQGGGSHGQQGQIGLPRDGFGASAKDTDGMVCRGHISEHESGNGARQGGSRENSDSAGDDDSDGGVTLVWSNDEIVFDNGSKI